MLAGVSALRKRPDLHVICDCMGSALPGPTSLAWVSGPSFDKTLLPGTFS